jgi:2-isopropylmalate synthase
VLETDYGIQMPREELMRFSQKVQEEAERTGEELTPEKVLALYRAAHG